MMKSMGVKTNTISNWRTESFLLPDKFSKSPSLRFFKILQRQKKSTKKLESHNPHIPRQTFAHERPDSTERRDTNYLWKNVKFLLVSCYIERSVLAIESTVEVTISDSE